MYVTFTISYLKFISSDPEMMYLLSLDHATQVSLCILFVWYTSLE